MQTKKCSWTFLFSKTNDENLKWGLTKEEMNTNFIVQDILLHEHSYRWKRKCYLHVKDPSSHPERMPLPNYYCRYSVFSLPKCSAQEYRQYKHFELILVLQNIVSKFFYCRKRTNAYSEQEYFGEKYIRQYLCMFEFGEGLKFNQIWYIMFGKGIPSQYRYHPMINWKSHK